MAQQPARAGAGRVLRHRHRRCHAAGAVAGTPVRRGRDPGHHLQHGGGEPVPQRPAARELPAGHRPAAALLRGAVRRRHRGLPDARADPFAGVPRAAGGRQR
ncbi:hypothetical protein G6F32_016795 [Rhizopus arrhizus]|uniref:Uncharacterized protein n=1 Tax=Rhizopus delemar TaxID=936053 RepID=A0A9P7C5W2_9FUNG|nr:hypothetical protein G6F32_016795 [Rhizopus arrhizus]KAG1536562.1 hypothetical protein G6F50_015033 [Rhizopus delemar]